MKIAYISPSELPSREANAVHVMMQVEALAKGGKKGQNSVFLYAKRAFFDESAAPAVLGENYGISFNNLIVRSYFSTNTLARSWRILGLFLRDFVQKRACFDVILSRNLYASFVLAVLLRQKLLFETHQLETGWRRKMHELTMTQKHVVTIVISEKLKEFLTEHHGVAPTKTVVLHDAAPCGEAPLPPEKRREMLAELVPESAGTWRMVCGYFGQLYAGRGVEIIAQMAAVRPQDLFLLYGGKEADIARCRAAFPYKNMLFMGHVPHVVAGRIMRAVDVLLMPYQQKVSIGLAGQDTARWMSPMKMFEYMAAGVPLISSDLPVLREVLRDGENALLAPAEDAAAWTHALDKLAQDSALAKQIAQTAYQEFEAHYTWDARAEKILDAAAALAAEHADT